MKNLMIILGILSIVLDSFGQSINSNPNYDIWLEENQSFVDYDLKSNQIWCSDKIDTSIIVIDESNALITTLFLLNSDPDAYQRIKDYEQLNFIQLKEYFYENESDHFVESILFHSDPQCFIEDLSSFDEEELEIFLKNLFEEPSKISVYRNELGKLEYNIELNQLDYLKFTMRLFDGDVQLCDNVITFIQKAFLQFEDESTSYSEVVDVINCHNTSVILTLTKSIDSSNLKLLITHDGRNEGMGQNIVSYVNLFNDEPNNYYYE